MNGCLLLAPLCAFPNVGLDCFCPLIRQLDAMAAEMAWRRSVQVDPHHSASNVATLSDEVAEVLSCNITFTLKLDLLLDRPEMTLFSLFLVR